MYFSQKETIKEDGVCIPTRSDLAQGEETNGSGARRLAAMHEVAVIRRKIRRDYTAAS
jgi:hypothetical protein